LRHGQNSQRRQDNQHTKARNRLVKAETPFHSPVITPAALLVTMIMPMSKGQPITTPSSPIQVMPIAYSDWPPNQKRPMSAPQTQPVAAPSPVNFPSVPFLRRR